MDFVDILEAGHPGGGCGGGVSGREQKQKEAALKKVQRKVVHIGNFSAIFCKHIEVGREKT